VRNSLYIMRAMERPNPHNPNEFLARQGRQDIPALPTTTISPKATASEDQDKQNDNQNG